MVQSTSSGLLEIIIKGHNYMVLIVKRFWARVFLPNFNLLVVVRMECML